MRLQLVHDVDIYNKTSCLLIVITYPFYEIQVWWIPGGNLQ